VALQSQTAAGHHIVPKGAKAKMVMLLTIFKTQAHGAKFVAWFH
jgi:hypothetical protein